MNYKKLLEKYDDMVLYSTIMLPECIEEATIDIGNVMRINMDRQEITKIIENEDIIGINKVKFFIAENDNRRFIYIDCHQKSDLYKICVRCLKKESKEVNVVVNKWYDMTAGEYGFPKGTDLLDWMNNKEEEINPFISSLKI